ncbi:hypothetical protein LINGRAHAP2_LOCUS7230 [Linum grandiflorum]
MELLDDSGGVTIPKAATDAHVDDYTLCALGIFVTEQSINFNAMQTQMANLWKPHEGISISDKGECLILFRFSHPLDRDLVLEGGLLCLIKTYLLYMSPWLVPTVEEQRVATLRRGGGDRQGQVRDTRPRPANIQAMAINFQTGILKGTTSLLHGLDVDASREVVVEVSEDQKRHKRNERGEADMDVDKENAMKLVITNEPMGRYPPPRGAGHGLDLLE